MSATQAACAVAGPPTRNLGLTAFSARAVLSYSSKVGFLLRRSHPEVQVGFVPDLEVPVRNLVNAIAIDKVLREGGDQRVPLRITWQAASDRLVPECLVSSRAAKALGMNPSSTKGPNPVRKHAVVDLIDIGPVIDQAYPVRFPDRPRCHLGICRGSARSENQ